MASVKLKNVYKYYEGNKKPSVQDFNLEIKDNEFVVFVGPSGCGKSTTLRMIAGLEEISEGEVLIDDVVVNDLEPIDRDIAMVFQNYALYPQKTVYQNIAFALKYKKINDFKKNRNGEYKLDKNGNKIPCKRHYTRSEIDQKVLEAAKILDIKEYLERKPKALSGGQRQRVAIGRAIVRNPKVFLMDEPLSNLDAKLRNSMRSEIILLRKRINSTFVYVTHDQVEAMTLGDRIVIMKDGVIQQIGTPNEVFSKPVNVFVATFIGTPQMNIINVKLEKKEKHFFIKLFDKEYKICEQQEKILLRNKIEGGEVLLGLRPDFLTLSNDKNAVVGNVIVSEMMGTEYHIQVDFNGTVVMVKVASSSLNNDDIINISRGGKVGLLPDMSKILIFDKESENAISL